MEKSLLRKHLENLVNGTYSIDINELADALNVEVENDRLALEALVDAPKSELQRVMMTAISWSEYVSSRKAMIAAKLTEFKINLDQQLAASKMKYISEKSGARGSKSEAEMHVESLPDFNESLAKLANYNAYVSYLESLSKQLDMVHYAAKEILRDYERQERIT